MQKHEVSTTSCRITPSERAAPKNSKRYEEMCL